MAWERTDSGHPGEAGIMADNEEQQMIRDILRPLRNNVCVVELGAHTGEDEKWIREACACGDENIHYVMVEPDPRNVNAILNRVFLGEGEPRPINRTRRLIVGAVSSRNGLQPFNLATNTKNRSNASGSLLTPSGHLKYIPEVSFTGNTMVETFTLDSVFEKEHLTKIDLLWVDIQGSEAHMIAEGKEALSHTRYAFLETEEIEMYAGQALYDTLDESMSDRGFKMVKRFQYNTLYRNLQFTERGPR
jgi:2-O-methyltransferase